jgi:hypothetical protein
LAAATLTSRVSPAFVKAMARATQPRLQRQHECLPNFPQRNALGSFT